MAQEAQADAEREPASAVGGLPALLNALPPGAASGVFVHSLLEWMAHTGFAAVAANPSALRDRVARGCALRQWPQLIDPLTEQLLAWLHTPLGLPGAPATLAGLDAYQAELEFWFALIKVVTIVAMILIGLAIIFFGITPLGRTLSETVDALRIWAERHMGDVAKAQTQYDRTKA